MIRPNLTTESNSIFIYLTHYVPEYGRFGHDTPKHRKVNIFPYPLLVIQKEFFMLPCSPVFSIYWSSWKSHDLADVDPAQEQSRIEHLLQEVIVKLEGFPGFTHQPMHKINARKNFRKPVCSPYCPKPVNKFDCLKDFLRRCLKEICLNYCLVSTLHSKSRHIS